MGKKSEATLMIFGVIGAIIIGIITVIVNIVSATADIIVYYKKPILIIISIGIGIYLTYQIFLILYFKSNSFKRIKNGINKHIKNCNDLNHYIQELKCSYVNITSYDFGQSRMVDTSNYNFKRQEWNKSIKSKHVHHCSASVCKNANNQPIKYFCKYFDVEKNEESLSNFERVLNDFTSVEQGKLLLQKEREKILKSISKSIPSIVLFFSKDRLIRKLGFEIVDFSDSYIPVFTFQYVSSGGNSSSKCDIKLNIENLNKLIKYLNDVIKWRKSIAGQRALMTSILREKIKQRDDYTCCNCNLSIKDEQNLLLEIDHIIPVSKGGLTTENNLQTLCWRCNRTKGAKIENGVEQRV
jgi:HNH endonuclease